MVKKGEVSTITQPQYSYLKGLIKKVGQEFYCELRVREGIVVGTTERQLSKKQAQSLIGHLKAEADRRTAQEWSGLFLIETYYGTTMIAEGDDALMDWADKRFGKDSLSRKQVKKFLDDKRHLTVAVPNYKITRETR